MTDLDKAQAVLASATPGITHRTRKTSADRAAIVLAVNIAGPLLSLYAYTVEQSTIRGACVLCRYTYDGSTARHAGGCWLARADAAITAALPRGER